MTGTLKEAALTTPNARSKLPVRSKPHWRAIDTEVHLGYRRGKRSGVWVVRWAIGGGNYHQAAVGTANDVIDEGNLSYDAAVKIAVAIVRKKRLEAAAAAAGPVQTVAGAVDAYMAKRDARETKRNNRPTNSDARSRLTLHVLSTPLAKLALSQLTISDITKWRNGLNGRPSSQQRTVNDLRAALNSADTDGALALVIKAGFKAASIDEDDVSEVAREGQILSDAQLSKLIGAARELDEANNWEGDWFRLVLLMAATGARFSQVARLRIGEFQPERNRILMPRSRKGKGKAGTTPIPLGSDVIAELLPLIENRNKNGPLLERWRHKPVPGKIATWHRVSRGPWTSASEMLRPWAATVAKAELLYVVPYSLRHSSVVRGLRLNLPVRLVASLHDTSVAMIERHYSKWIADGLEDIAARAIVPLVPNLE